MSYTHPKFPSGYATIRVTQEDIDNGERGNCELCPIAHAMSRELGCAVDVSGPCAVVYIHGPVEIPLPQEARNFILDFDNVEPVQPFEFQIPWRP